jgi:hypothetical protein
MAKTNLERVTSYRDRQRAGIKIPQCHCGRLLKGQLSQRRRICQRCFLDSADGKHRAWVRVSATRDRNALQEYLPEWGNWKVGGRAIAPDGSIGVVSAIALYVDGSVGAIVQFEHDSESFLISSLNPLISY